MSSVRATVEGLKELEAAFKELTRATAKNVARKALRKAGEPLAETARQLVPVDQGELRDSITVSARLATPAGKAAYATAMRQTGGNKAAALAAMRDARRAASGSTPAVQMYVGAGKVKHAHLVEFGTVKMAAQPFMRPAWDQHKGRMIDVIREELAAELEKARQRAVRKAARLAKKAGQ